MSRTPSVDYDVMVPAPPRQARPEPMTANE